jgi:hypothetical protein
MKFRLVFTLGLAVVLVGGSVSAQQFRFQAGDRDNVRVRVHTAHILRDHATEMHEWAHEVREWARVTAREVGTHVRAHFDLVDGTTSVGQPGDPCRDNGWDDDNYRSCEVREYTMPVGPLTVDAGRNGGIRVEGWDQNDVRVQAIVTASARSESDAKQLASEVQVQAGGGKVSAIGPASTDRGASWSVSYRISVPRRTDLDLAANNGGITIDNVSGNIKFETTNGGVRLTDLAGDVRGQTRNGGVTVTLAGTRWDGAGLDVETANGGVTVAIPDNYNADLTTRTVNGGFRSDIPMTIQGDLLPQRGLSTTLGSGGPPVNVRTTNGGVKISRR